MTRDNIDYTHGDTGTKPTSLNFDKDERPKSEHFDWFWYEIVEKVKYIINQFDRLDSDDDGVVDAADGAGTWHEGGTEKSVRPTDVDLTDELTLTDNSGTAVLGVNMYTDDDARNAVTTYTDSEARTAVDGSNVNITGDAGTVEGKTSDELGVKTVQDLNSLPDASNVSNSRIFYVESRDEYVVPTQN